MYLCWLKLAVYEKSVEVLFLMNGGLVSQDNVFVNVVASIQYRALANQANDAFYKLSNTKGQIQAYVFDGIVKTYLVFVSQ